jgi:hypothetical protein
VRGERSGRDKTEIAGPESLILQVYDLNLNILEIPYFLAICACLILFSELSFYIDRGTKTPII